MPPHPQSGVLCTHQPNNLCRDCEIRQRTLPACRLGLDRGLSPAALILHRGRDRDHRSRLRLSCATNSHARGCASVRTLYPEGACEVLRRPRPGRPPLHRRSSPLFANPFLGAPLKVGSVSRLHTAARGCLKRQRIGLLSRRGGTPSSTAEARPRTLSGFPLNRARSLRADFIARSPRRARRLS